MEAPRRPSDNDCEAREAATVHPETYSECSNNFRDRRLELVLWGDCGSGERAAKLSGETVFPSRLFEPSRPTARERAVGTRLKIGKDIVDEGSDIGIASKAIHHERAALHPFKNNAPEGFSVR